MWLDDTTLAHLRDVADWPDIGGRYEITGRLGRGGMGTVYAARDRTLDREVAVKVLDGFDQRLDPTPLVDEARVLGQLEHPGIVPVHDAGSLPDGRVYYVMKLIRGQPLSLAIATRSLNERLDLFLRVCETVSFAHSRGVVHRDLKPDNIMSGPFGEVLVMDWGTAHTHFGKYAPQSDATAPAIVGTPGFMAPEQQRGSPEIDGRADVYSLGVILGGLLSPPLPKPLAAIARRASADRPEDRYHGVQDLARDVMRYRDGDPVTAYRENVVERLQRLYRRYQLPILLVLAYVMMRLLLLFWRGI